MCSIAFRFALRAFSEWPSLASLKYCQDEKAVHIGDPMIR